MCGIFGFHWRNFNYASQSKLERLLADLMKLSEYRGQEAAGLSIAGGGAIFSFKRPLRARSMLAEAGYRHFIRSTLGKLPENSPISVIGHSRLMTNGSQALPENNQPVILRNLVGVHNGIIVNTDSLVSAGLAEAPRGELDSEVLFSLLEMQLIAGNGYHRSLVETFHHIEGVANIAVLTACDPALVLASNSGSLYFSQAGGEFLFASEREFVKRAASLSGLDADPVQQVQAGQAVVLSVADGKLNRISLQKPANSFPERKENFTRVLQVMPEREARPLRRCTRCILPETFPGISFDSDGVCSVCRRHHPQQVLGRDALLETLTANRIGKSGECLVALSGGRDSCYALHYVCKELGLKAIAYTYDWGMVTDEARRNASRMCAKLGIEHIIRTADIATKRENIRRNIIAWSHRPDLGIIPLFMAGDKMFYEIGRKLRDETNASSVLFCAGNPLERTEFKSGFCGVKETSHGNRLWSYSIENKLMLLSHYMKQFSINPRLINRSLFDTARAFWSTYLRKDDFVYFYHYIPWDEVTITNILTKEYGWESAADSKTSWRIGDGTASFYNYIYYNVAGFSEHDTFRSNQVRYGLISRSEALDLAAQDNQPRWDSMRNYAALVGFNLDRVLTVVHSMPRLYD